MNKEQIYDEQIEPLMAQIINICQANSIDFLASFAIPIDNDPSLMCTSALLKGDDEGSTSLKSALRVIRKPHESFAFTITRTPESA